MTEKNTLDASLTAFDEMQTSVTDYEEMLLLSEEDEAMQDEIFALLENLEVQVSRAELEALLSGEADANDAYLEIHAGSGGTEAQDWGIFQKVPQHVQECRHRKRSGQGLRLAWDGFQKASSPAHKLPHW